MKQDESQGCLNQAMFPHPIAVAAGRRGPKEIKSQKKKQSRNHQQTV